MPEVVFPIWLFLWLALGAWAIAARGEWRESSRVLFSLYSFLSALFFWGATCGMWTFYMEAQRDKVRNPGYWAFAVGLSLIWLIPGILACRSQDNGAKRRIGQRLLLWSAYACIAASVVCGVVLVVLFLLILLDHPWVHQPRP